MVEEQTLLDRAHTYTVECDSNLTLFADRNMIKQFLHTVIDNSVKYTPAGGGIGFIASMDGDGVSVTVVDSGIGMEPEPLSHIFERFYRADKARARATGGLGLGLSIAASIVAAHGGSISAQSEAGKGTAIRAVFPL